MYARHFGFLVLLMVVSVVSACVRLFVPSVSGVVSGCVEFG